MLDQVTQKQLIIVYTNIFSLSQALSSMAWRKIGVCTNVLLAILTMLQNAPIATSAYCIST